MSSERNGGSIPTTGSHERHIARGTLAQQASQAVGVVAMLIVITLLGRTLTLREFGVYGLLISLAAYLLIVQVSVEGAAVRAIAAAVDAAERNRVFSTALALYAVCGLGAGLVIALGGVGLVGVLGVPDSLKPAAREGVVALGAVTALGWPFKVFQDALRGTQRFFLAASAEICAYVAFVAAMVVLVEVGAPMWGIVMVGGSVPVLIGVASAVILTANRVPFRFDRSAVTVAAARELLGFTAYLSVIGVTDLIIYQLDRVILAAFRSTATVGLYEGAARPHALVRQLHSTLILTVMPVASGYLATGDQVRLRELLLRGTRYVLAVVVPVTVVLMVLSGPILRVWLGARFTVAAGAMAIFLSYWLVAANTGVAGAMLVAAGRLRQLTIYTWAVTIVNLGLSLWLTSLIGLDGVVLGTAIPAVALFPYFMAIVLRSFPVTLAEFAREAWLPAYATGALAGAALGAIRLTMTLDTLPTVIAAAAGALALAWASYYVLWLRPNERLLVRTLFRRGAVA